MTISAHTYLKSSISLANDRKYWVAFQHIDLAIMLGDNKAFYFYQKIKLLYTLNFHEDCMQLILGQLKFLYTNASLYIFSKVLYYYESITHCSKDELIYLLIQNDIPKCLAYEYPMLIESKFCNFSQKAFQANANGQYTLAIAYCNLNIKQNDINPKLLYLKGYCYHCLGDLDNAQKAYTSLIDAFPNSHLGYSHLALCCIEKSCFSEAERFLKKALELAPDNVHYFYYLAECYERWGKHNEAIDHYTSLLGRFPNTKQIYYHLYSVYKKQKNKKLSKKYYKLWI